MRINSLSVDIDTLNASIRALNDRLAGLRGLWEALGVARAPLWYLLTCSLRILGTSWT